MSIEKDTTRIIGNSFKIRSHGSYSIEVLKKLTSITTSVATAFFCTTSLFDLFLRMKNGGSNNNLPSRRR